MLIWIWIWIWIWMCYASIYISLKWLINIYVYVYTYIYMYTHTHTHIYLSSSNYHSECGWCLKGQRGSVATGGILHFDDGTFIKGFTHFLWESSTGSFAEAMVVLCGISLAIDKGFTSFMIQIDSLVLVSMVQGSFPVP